MSRLAGFYIAKMVESAAASGAPPRRARDHAARDAIRGRTASHRVAAAVHRFIGGLARAGRGRHKQGQLRPVQPTRQPSAQ